MQKAVQESLDLTDSESGSTSCGTRCLVVTLAFGLEPQHASGSLAQGATCRIVARRKCGGLGGIDHESRSRGKF